MIVIHYRSMTRSPLRRRTVMKSDMRVRGGPEDGVISQYTCLLQQQSHRAWRYTHGGSDTQLLQNSQTVYKVLARIHCFEDPRSARYLSKTFELPLVFWLRTVHSLCGAGVRASKGSSPDSARRSSGRTLSPRFPTCHIMTAL